MSEINLKTNNMEKQLIERELKFSKSYSYIGLTHGSIESGQMCNCDNCGKLITNMVTVHCKEDNKQFVIGTDCMDTLIQAKRMFQHSNKADYFLDLSNFNAARKFVNYQIKGFETESDGFYLRVINAKGKPEFFFPQHVKQYYPTKYIEYAKQFGL